MKEAVTKVIDMKLLEPYNKCIESGGDYFEGE